MTPIQYRQIINRQDADIKAMAAITVLDNENPETLAESIDYFRTELEQMNPEQMVLTGAFAGNELVGFSRFSLCQRLGLWWCLGLEVVVEWQRRGIGKMLLTTPIEQLRSQGHCEFRSDTSMNNHASQATHLAAGFTQHATDDIDFDGQQRENRCFLKWFPQAGR